MVGTVSLDEPCTADVRREVAAMVDADELVIAVVHDERRHVDERKDVTDVELENGVEPRASEARASPRTAPRVPTTRRPRALGTTDGARSAANVPVPQCSSIARDTDPARAEACPRDSRRRAEPRESVEQDERGTHAGGFAAAGTTAICVAWPCARIVASLDPTASITASRSSTHDSTGITPPTTERDIPIPRRSNQSTRENRVSAWRNSSKSGCSQSTSR